MLAKDDILNFCKRFGYSPDEYRVPTRDDIKPGKEFLLIERCKIASKSPFSVFHKKPETVYVGKEPSFVIERGGRKIEFVTFFSEDFSDTFTTQLDIVLGEIDLSKGSSYNGYLVRK